MFNAPVTIADPGVTSDPAPAPVRVVRTLRADTATFTGRTEQVREITRAFEHARGGVVAIHAIDGMPGIGKTALAVHVAHQLVDRCPDGQLFVDLHAHTINQNPTDPADVLAGLLIATGLSPEYIPDSLQERASRWRDRVAGRRLLLVLDNAATGEQVAPLLPGSGSCLVLVTSRRRLTSLRRDYGATLLPLGVLPEPDAVELFVRICPRHLSADEHAAVVEVVRLCGRLPLAIAILAAGIELDHAASISELAGELAAAQDRLAEIDERLDDREIGVASAFTLSNQRLSAEQQRVLRLVSLTPGADVDPFAAAALTDLPLAVVRRHLRDLHRHHLVENSTGHQRYRLHDLITAYARRQATPDEVDQAVGRLLDYYQHAASVATGRTRLRALPSRRSATPAGGPIPDLPDHARATTWLRTERANLLACIAHTRQRQDHTRTVHLTASLTPVLRLDGPWPEGIELHTHALTISRDLGDRHAEARALTELGVLRRMTGEYLQATSLQEEALAIFREAGDRTGEARAVAELGVVRRMTGEYLQATSLQEMALAIFRELGDRTGEAWAVAELGVVRKMTGDDYTQATLLLEQALTTFRSLGDGIGEAWVLTDLGVLRQRTGDFSRAGTLLEQALTMNRDVGNRTDEAWTLSQLGVLRRMTGDYAEATALLQEALTTSEELGDRYREAWVCADLGVLRRITGDYAEAAALLQRALTTSQELGDNNGQAWAYADLGVLRRITGDYAQATALLQQAMSIFGDLGDNNGQACTLAELGVLRRITGDHAQATALLQRALTMSRDLGDRQREVEVLNHTGDLLRVCGEPGQAYAQHTAALDLARSLGSPLEEARALAGIGRCTLGAEDASYGSEWKHALALFQRLGAAEAIELTAEIDTHSSP